MATAADRSANPWIQSPRWDVWWIFSGLWAPALAACGYGALQVFTSVEVPIEAPPPTHMMALFAILGILHRLSPIYTVLFTPILRDAVRADPARFLYVPGAILLGSLLIGQCVVFHASFSFLGSESAQLWAFSLLAAIFIVWDRWHFCMQEFGVLSIYRIRAGQNVPADRAFDRAFTILLMLFVNAFLFMIPGTDQREILFRGTPLARLEGAVFEGALTLMFAVAIVATSVAVVREWRHPRRSFPKVWFYLLVGSHSLLLFLFPHALGLFFLGYIFHHWMVAIGLFNRVIAASYRVEDRSAVAVRYLAGVGPALLLCVLFYASFGVLDMPGHLQPPPGLDSFEGMPVLIRVTAGLGLGIFFAFNYLHYWYDRQVYSFSNPRIRASVGPLLFGAPRQADHQGEHR
jgi:hypothetical protein